MRNFLAFSSLAMVALTLPLAAESENPEFEASIAAFGERFGLTETTSLDINQSGAAEVLLRQMENCATEGCAWSLLAFDGASVFEVGSGEAQIVRLQPAGDAGGVLFADSVTWAFDGHMLYPYGDVISMGMNRATLADEITWIRAQDGYDSVDRSEVMTWSFTYLQDERPSHGHVHAITGWEYQIGSWGTPYFILDGEGDLIAQGYSTDHPRVFPDLENGGFIVVDLVPAGFSVATYR